jgi:hypothetical protein
MRKGLIVILAIGALASIALCAAFGWDQATEQKDRITQAFVYGFVALATLALHAVALRIWVAGWRKTGGFIGVIAMLAFIMTAFTSLGGLASRADRVVAERQDAIDTKADTKKQIADLLAEKTGLKAPWTTQAAVDAAQRLANAAAANREAECAKRGDNCRNREGDERKALEALAAAQASKATTDRIIEIDADLKRLRAVKTNGTIGSADTLKALLSPILGVWADVLTSWQKVAFALIYDLCLVALMIGIEVLGHIGVARPSQPDMRKKPENVSTSEEPALPVNTKPKLVVTTANPSGSVPSILTEHLESAPGKKVEIAEIGRRYRDVCKERGKAPVKQDVFVNAVDMYCRKVGIKRQTIDDSLYLMDVQLMRLDHKVVKT